MHNIEYFDYNEKIDKKTVQDELGSYVDHHSDGNGGIEPIRWNNYVCKDYKEAEEWIKKNDKGWYDQVAVKYYSPISIKTAKTDELDKKIKEAYNVFSERINVCYPKTRTSEFIGCKKCKSRLASKYLFANYCPVCRADLRPETLTKSIAAARTKWENAQKNKAEYVDKHSKKEIRWLVKIEYHT